jgi:hypothetical protein
VFYGLLVLLIFLIFVLCCFSGALLGENSYIYGFGTVYDSCNMSKLKL